MFLYFFRFFFIHFALFLYFVSSSRAYECGKISNVRTLRQSSNKNNEKLKSPWSVAIYIQKSGQEINFICGGTLITPEYVVSAAHCFYDFRTKEKLDNKSQNFSVVVAKHTIDFKIKDSAATKIYSVKKVMFSETWSFFGEVTSFASDIALLQLSEKVALSGNVLPACVYTDNQNEFNLAENSTGIISGFKFPEEGISNREVQTDEYSYSSYLSCLQSFDSDLEVPLSMDIFCAKPVSSHRGRFISGAGLTFKNNKDGLYYLRGVSSRGQPERSTTIFTDVNFHSKWLKKVAQL